MSCLTISQPPTAGRFRHVVTPTPAQCAEARLQLGWSRERLARAAGISMRAMLDYELGLRTPRAGTLIAIRRAFRTAGAPLPAPAEAAVEPSRGGSPSSRATAEAAEA